MFSVLFVCVFCTHNRVHRSDLSYFLLLFISVLSGYVCIGCVPLCLIVDSRQRKTNGDSAAGSHTRDAGDGLDITARVVCAGGRQQSEVRWHRGAAVSRQPGAGSAHV